MILLYCRSAGDPSVIQDTFVVVVGGSHHTDPYQATAQGMYSPAVGHVAQLSVPWSKLLIHPRISGIHKIIGVASELAIGLIIFRGCPMTMVCYTAWYEGTA